MVLSKQIRRERPWATRGGVDQTPQPGSVEHRPGHGLIHVDLGAEEHPSLLGDERATPRVLVTTLLASSGTSS